MSSQVQCLRGQRSTVSWAGDCRRAEGGTVSEWRAGPVRAKSFFSPPKPTKSAIQWVMGLCLRVWRGRGMKLKTTFIADVKRGQSCRLRLKCDGTRAETRFRLSAKRTSPFKSAGASVQSTGSRGVRISGSNAGYTMFRGSVKGIVYPLHSPVSPSLPLPCVTVCHHNSTGLYLLCPTRVYDVHKDKFTFTLTEKCNSLNWGLLWRRAWCMLQADNTQKLKDLTIVTRQQSTPLPVGSVTTLSALRYTFSKFHFYVGNTTCWSTESAVSVASHQNRRRNQYRVRCASKLFECRAGVTLRELGPTACLTFCAVLPTVQIFPHSRPFLAHDEA